MTQGQAVHPASFVASGPFIFIGSFIGRYAR